MMKLFQVASTLVVLPCMLIATTLCHAQRTDGPGDTVALRVPTDQALAALHPSTGPLDLDADPPSDELRTLLGGASRGPAASVFPNVAPSVVIVRAGGAYGTGFIVKSDGWILTNHHVIAGASMDIDSGARFAHIHFGKLRDGFMQLDRKEHPAFVHATNPEKDLALLKLVKLPVGPPLKPIALASDNAAPGTDCLTIGHPSRGLFWSLRSGEVVGIGQYPGDMIETVMPQFSMTTAARESFVESLQQNASRKALISSCGINPGDSGGPLLNMQGELIAVNFAIPKSEKDSQVNLDKFSYHVHLDEVRKFVADLPAKPEVAEPEIWPPATFSRLLDRDENGDYETWLFGLKEGEPATGLLWDLDTDTPATFVSDFAERKADRRHFDAEVAWARVPVARMFYDRNNDGTMDMILTDLDDDGTSDLTIVRTEGNWSKVEAPQPMLDPMLLASVQLQERFQQIVVKPVEAAQRGNASSAADSTAEPAAPQPQP